MCVYADPLEGGGVPHPAPDTHADIQTNSNAGRSGTRHPRPSEIKAVTQQGTTGSDNVAERITRLLADCERLRRGSEIDTSFTVQNQTKAELIAAADPGAKRHVSPLQHHTQTRGAARTT